MLTEGDLATSADQSNRVREMQDKIASLRAQVNRNNRIWTALMFSHKLMHLFAWVWGKKSSFLRQISVLRKFDGSLGFPLDTRGKGRFQNLSSKVVTAD